MTVALPGYDSFDPAFAWTGYSWQVEYATCLRLVSYSDDPAPAGYQLVPEAATTLPTVSPNGLVYTFTVKSTFLFSNGSSVTADSFRRAIERTAAIPNAPGYPDISDIAGIVAYHNNPTGSISGVQVTGNTLTITLTQPDGALPAKLAMPFFCAVPAGTPLSESDTVRLPSAGPYYISSGSPNPPGFILHKNPYYTGSRPAGFDQIVVEINSNLSATYAAAQDPSSIYEEGPTVDYTRVGPSDQAGANSSFGPGSPAAAAGHQQYFTPINGAVRYLALNTSRSGLADVGVRQAIATAIDRTQLASDLGETPTDDFVSPITAGYVDEHNFNLSGDVAAAQNLMQQAGYGPSNHLTLKLITNTSTAQVAVGNDIVSELAKIYIDVTYTPLPASQYFQTILTQGTDWDLSYFGWLPDYTDWAGVVNPLLDGRTMTVTSVGLDASHWNDPSTNASLDYANALPPGIDRNTAYEHLATSLARDSVPMAAVSQVADHEFVSSRVGCVVHQPVYGLDLARLCPANPVSAGDTYKQPGTVSSSNPVLAAVTAPADGAVSVVDASASSALSGYNVVGQQLLINAPDAPDTDHPLSITLTIDAATLAASGLTASTATVLRNGVSIPACSPNDGTVSHGDDPCVTSRTTDGSGNAVITILSSHASVWNSGKRDSTPPTLHAVSLGSITIGVQHSTTISVSASADAVFAEFYTDTDAGAGKNLPLGGQAGSFVSPPYGRLLSPGLHNIGVRVRDAAGNWSPVKVVQLRVVVASAKPTLISRPILSGTAAVGKKLTTTKGTWTNSPTGYAYKWQRCDTYGSNCVGIASATHATYTLVAADAGHKIRSEVEASNAAGPSAWGFMPSLATGVVKRPLLAGTTTCNGTYSGTGEDVVVPAGDTCTLIPGTYVEGRVVVKPGGSLHMNGVRIGVDLTMSGSATVCGSRIGRNIVATLGSFELGGPGCAGNKIAGDTVVTHDANSVTVQGNTIINGLTVKKLTGATDSIVRNLVFGGLLVASSGPPVEVSGNHAYTARCANNKGQTGSGNHATSGINTCPH